MAHLTPHRHRQLDFFVADILDAAPKDDWQAWNTRYSP